MKVDLGVLVTANIVFEYQRMHPCGAGFLATVMQYWDESELDP